MSLNLLNIAQSIQKCNRRLPNIWVLSSFRPSESSQRMRRWSVSVTWHAHDHIVCIVCLALLHTWYVLTHAWNEIGVEIRGRDWLQFACLLRNSVVSLCILLSQWMVTDVHTCVAEWLPTRNRLCLQLGGILTCIYCMRERCGTVQLQARNPLCQSSQHSPLTLALLKSFDTCTTHTHVHTCTYMYMYVCMYVRRPVQYASPQTHVELLR